MSRLADIARWPRQLLRKRPDELSAVPRALALWWHLGRTCLRKMGRDRAAQMAAALSFQTLFSLIPMLVLALLLVHSVRGLEEAGELLRTTVIDYVLPESLLEPRAIPAGAEDSPTVEEFDDARQVLRQRVDDVLERVSEVSFASIGAIGFFLFLYGATALMGTMESSFNLIYQAEETRSLAVRLPLYFTVIVLSPMALVAGQVIQERIFQTLLLGGQVGRWMAGVLSFLAPLFVVWLLLTLLFRLLPNTWVHWRCAATGAFVSGLAWLLFQELFNLYLSRTVLASLYGALALLPLSLLWMYWSWLLLLFGLTLSYRLQFLPLEGAGEPPPLAGDPRWLLPILGRVAITFQVGEELSLATLSRELRLAPRFVRSHLRVLEKAGLVRRVRAASGDDILTLARSASSIRVADVLGLQSRLEESAGPLRHYLEELRKREIEAADDLTLEELISEQEPSQNGETSGPRS